MHIICNIRYIILRESLGSRRGNWEMPIVLSKNLILGSRLGTWEMPIVLSKVFGSRRGNWEMPIVLSKFLGWQLGDADRALYSRRHTDTKTWSSLCCPELQPLGLLPGNNYSSRTPSAIQ